MDYENDPYIDEDGVALMDPGDLMLDREPLPYTRHKFDDKSSDEWRSERSPTPTYDEGKFRKRRKRLIKKVVKQSSPEHSGSTNGKAFHGEDLDDWDEEEPVRKKMSLGKDSSSKEKRKVLPKSGRSTRKASPSGSKGGYGVGSSNHASDPEVQELWDAITGDDLEGDREGARTAYDHDAFAIDIGVDQVDHFGNDNESGFIGYAPQAEEDNEMKNKLFKGGKKKKNEKSPAELAMVIEDFMAELEVTAEEDAELNRQNKPAINKLQKLPFLIDVLSKKKFQLEFLDHGVLTLLKNWLEPLPDGSLPNMNIRTAILKLLSEFPIDLEQYDRREQLKQSGLGKVIMFLSRSDEEATSNRKLAKELVDRWSRPIFNKSTRFEDLRSYEDERIPYRRPAPKPVNIPEQESRDEDLDEFSQRKKSLQAASRQHASLPEASPLVFVVRPQSKIDPEEIRAQAKQAVQNQQRQKLSRKLQLLKAPKRKQLWASKLNVEG
ncbi:protein IWS1 homolog 1-like [Dendrobium catenatum]|uniref:TFIIS N-terminal domain-containing protein n=1 Tax=Dendrobium catenatum TaxID=906689 RepID=A0A2I0VM86_9ASPA|nr:protein IWS1 homolog 1-like [Dendrobium catenatum]PKU64516.1 hypothetical protein MA16_Dca008439 [Dendrobium catenatum]